MKKYHPVLSLLIIVFLAILTVTAQEQTQKKTKKEGKKEIMDSKESSIKQQEVVVVETNMGTIKLEMFRDVAPKTVENFVKLAKKGYYNGITFHRVIDNFMIQGGDPTGTGGGGQSIYGKTFEDEISPNYKFDKPGILAMANAGPNTNGSQFFITLVPTAWLNGKHTIFGKVVNGMDVVQKIGKVQTSKPGDKPITPVVMKKVYPGAHDPEKTGKGAEEKKQ